MICSCSTIAVEPGPVAVTGEQLQPGRGATFSRGLARQGLPYTIFGVGALFIDWGTFVLLSWLGLAVPLANVAGRIAGAVVGFLLNGRYTFATAGKSMLGSRQLLRYFVTWTALTVLSTLAVTLLASEQWLWLAWLAKPAIDATLAGTAFIVSKRWIFR